jgi:hypothetical protein
MIVWPLQFPLAQVGLLSYKCITLRADEDILL